MSNHTPDEWYRKAWEALWLHSDDEEASAIEDVMVRSGFFTKCYECGFCEVSEEAGPACCNCGSETRALDTVSV